MKTHVTGLLFAVPITIALVIGVWSISTGKATFDPSFLEPDTPAQTTNR